MKIFKNLFFLLLSCVAISHTVNVVAAPILGYPVGRTSSEGKASPRLSLPNLLMLERESGLRGPSENVAYCKAKPLVSKRGDRCMFSTLSYPLPNSEYPY